MFYRQLQQCDGVTEATIAWKSSLTYTAEINFFKKKAEKSEEIFCQERRGDQSEPEQWPQGGC